MSSSEWVLLGAGIIGVVFGSIGQLSGFCLRRALHNHWVQRDTIKLRAFALAMLVALLLSQLLSVLTEIDFDDALYTQTSISWLLIPFGAILFGYGMVKANGCGARALVLLGQGNLRSMLVLFCIGVSAYMTLSGVLAPVRLWFESWSMASLPESTLPGLAQYWGLSQPLALWLTVGAIIAVMGVWIARSAEFLRAHLAWISGLVVGILVATGWWVTGVVGQDFFAPTRLASLTFVAPVGESIQYLMIATGMTPTFNIVLVGGVLLGSFFTALLRGAFEWQSFTSVQQMKNAIIGGLMMGTGGALALGCSIGQGLTGFSTLAITSVVALTGIVFGAWLGIKSFMRVR